MTRPEAEFNSELESFRAECEGAAQFFFGYLAIHEVAGRRKQVRRVLDRNAMFWNTTTAALQASAIMAIGRIFDQSSQHNVDRILKLAQTNQAMFSKQALAARKQGGAAEPPPWLNQYLANVYVPTATDFRRLRAHVNRRRRVYVTTYRQLRHQVFAHKSVLNETEARPLFAKTSKPELERLILFLLRFYESMWGLFMDGRKPTLRRLRYSVSQAGRLSLPRTSAEGVHKAMVVVTERVLRAAAAQQAAAPDGRPTRGGHG